MSESLSPESSGEAGGQTLSGACRDSPATLLQLADQCVKCGYCLPHCPTFQLARDESESPRGRIALIQGWLNGALDLSPRLDAHLDHCLECRACEPDCPSLVEFGRLMDGARSLREARRSLAARLVRRSRLALFADPGLGWGWGVIGWLRRLMPVPERWFGKVAGRWPAFQVREPMVRALWWPLTGNELRRLATVSLQRASRSLGAPAQRVAPAMSLFRGCVARAAQPSVERAAVRVLARLRIAVSVPDAQDCCGAIHRHNGYPVLADQRIAQNRRSFGVAPVVGLSSACVAELREHGQLNAHELCRLLLDLEWPRDVRLAPLHAKVAVHTPCSHRNLLKDASAATRLLQRIPGLQLSELPDNQLCCGAAGTYLLDHASTALTLVRPKIRALAALKPDYLVTTNSGCALHLAAQARAAGVEVAVVHPVELIERQLSVVR